MSQYDRLSRWYDLLAEGSEGRLRRKALVMLAVQPGERVLEIGVGTGHGLVGLAQAAGRGGQIYGIDLSGGMLRETRRRMLRIGERCPISLIQGDGLNLPLPQQRFDAAFLSFTLELFEESDRIELLREVKRVLSPGGRLGVVALARGKNGWMVQGYQWAHQRFPSVIDCRPIDVENELHQSGWKVLKSAQHMMWGLPVTIAMAE